ncbi:MAG: tetratricopeptide repeat protein [Polyangia bacterium]
MLVLLAPIAPGPRSRPRAARRRGRLAALLLGAVVVVTGFGPGGTVWGPGRAAAADSPERRASAHLARAAELYQAGSYKPAIVELQAAYAANPLPRILCNLAKAYRKDGQLKEAAEHYDLCLRTDPHLSPQERAEFGDSLAQLRAALEPPRVEQRPAPVPPVSTLQAAPTAPPGTAAPEARPVYKRAWFWGVLGGVVAAGAVATVAGVLATRSTAPTLTEPELPVGVPVFAWQ